MSPLTLETDRLVIRCFQPEDLPAIHRLLDQTFGDGRLVDDAAALRERRSWLEWSMLSEEWFEKMHQPPYGDRAITLKHGGAVTLAPRLRPERMRGRAGRVRVGAIGYVPLLMPFEQIPELCGAAGIEPSAARATPEVGLFWAIDPQHQRRGYASEAARALIAHAFQTLRLKRILATTESGNLASQGVMLKAGMRLARNPWPEPRWLQGVGVRDSLEAARD